MLNTKSGTAKFIAAGPVALGANVYGAANGEVDDLANDVFIGIALDDATTTDDVIEILRMAQPNAAGDPLVRLAEIIDFEAFRPTLNRVHQKARKDASGR